MVVEEPCTELVTNTTQSTTYCTLQEAIAAANADDNIEIAAGTLVESGQIVIEKNLTITGAGKAETILKLDFDTENSGNPRGWWLVNPGVELNLADLTLDGSGFLVHQAIRTRGSGTIDNVRFTEIKYNESGPDYNGVAVAAFGNGNVDVSNCEFDEIGRVGVLYFGTGISASNFFSNSYVGKGDGDWLDYCLDISAGANVTAHGNTISNCSGVASTDGSTSAGILVSTFFAPGTEATISDNLFADNTTGVIVGADASDASVTNVHENNFVGNDFGVTSTAPIVDAKFNYWNSAYGPTHASNECGTGDAVSDNVTFIPYYEDDVRSTLRESCNAEPVAYWPLDEGTGTLAEDVTVNTNDGTIMGGEEWVAGVDGGGLKFDGVDNKIDAGSDASIDMGTGDFSIAAWIKMDPTQNTFPTLLAKGAGNNTDVGYWFLVKNNRLRLYISDGSSRLKAESNAVVAYDNLWHHVAAVIDRDDMVTFYVDGFAAGTFNVSSFDGMDITSARNLTIGSWFNYSYTYLNACMDDIRLYDAALDASEVEMLAGTFGVNNPPVVDVEATATPAVVLLPATTQLVVVASDLDEDDILTYSWSKLSGVGEVTFTPNNDPSSDMCTASFSAEGEYVLRVTVSDGADFVTSDVEVLVISDGTEPPAPVADWPMDENAGTTTEDVTLNTNDGTLVNGTAWTSGISGSALLFDGVNDRVDCGTGDELNMGAGDFTISSWVNLGTQYATFPTLVANGAGNTTDAGYWLLMANSRLRLYVSDGTTRLKAESNPIAITDNSWYHIAVVIDRDGNISFYVDGAVAGTVDVSSLDGANITNSRNFTIGSFSSYSYTLIEGKMDDTKLFNVALDASQVGDLFNEFASFKKALVKQLTSSVDEVKTYPNPFTSSTTLAFNLEGEQHVNITVFDMHGNTVAVLKNEQMQMGRHSISWNGQDGSAQILPAGMYIVRIIGENNVVQKTIMKLK
jgi:hypothetical protein